MGFRNGKLYVNFEGKVELDALFHELEHFIDAATCGSINPSKDMVISDQNDPSFVYAAARQSQTVTPEKEAATHVSEYAMTGPMEDKAETFGYLIGKGWLREVASPHIREKMKIILARMARLAHPGYAGYFVDLTTNEAR